MSCPPFPYSRPAGTCRTLALRRGSFRGNLFEEHPAWFARRLLRHQLPRECRTQHRRAETVSEPQCSRNYFLYGCDPSLDCFYVIDNFELFLVTREWDFVLSHVLKVECFPRHLMR